MKIDTGAILAVASCCVRGSDLVGLPAFAAVRAEIAASSFGCPSALIAVQLGLGFGEPIDCFDLHFLRTLGCC